MSLVSLLPPPAVQYMLTECLSRLSSEINISTAIPPAAKVVRPVANKVGEVSRMPGLSSECSLGSHFYDMSLQLYSIFNRPSSKNTPLSTPPPLSLASPEPRGTSKNGQNDVSGGKQAIHSFTQLDFLRSFLITCHSFDVDHHCDSSGTRHHRRGA